MSRQADLLREAADALNDGRDPLTNPFLSEHGVTLDECYDMADFLALGARLIAWAVENPKRAGAAFRGAVDGASMEIITETLRRMNEASR